MKMNKVSRSSFINYTDEPIKLGKRVIDFLPKPEELVLKETKKRVTITLSESSLDFFKRAAKKYGASYQAMIRRLLDLYAANQRM